MRSLTHRLRLWALPNNALCKFLRESRDIHERSLKTWVKFGTVLQRPVLWKADFNLRTRWDCLIANATRLRTYEQDRTGLPNLALLWLYRRMHS